MLQPPKSSTRHAQPKIHKNRNTSESRQEIEVVNLVPVLHDVSLDLGGVNPRDKVFHVSVAELARQRLDWQSS